MKNTTFWLLTASLLQGMRLTDYTAPFISWRLAVIVININRESRIEIPEAWMPTIKKHSNSRTVQQRTAKVTTTCRNNRGLKCTNHSRSSWYKWCCIISQPRHLKTTSSKQLKRRDLHLKWLHPETYFIVIVSTTMNNNNLFLDTVVYSPTWPYIVLHTPK